MNLTELQREAHAIAKDHGWWDEERTFGDLIALVHSELSEALEWYREWEHVQPMREESPQYGLDDPVHGKYKPVGVPSELADVVIRVADMAEWCECQLTDSIPTQVYVGQSAERSFGEWIALLHHCFSEALEARWRKKLSTSPDWDGWWDWACQGYRWVRKMAAHYGIDLDAAIEAKMGYNRTRSYRHGGKAL